MLTHGKASTYGEGCRCADCRAANTRKGKRQTANRLARPQDVPHGTLSGYCNWACRCDPCRAAGRARNARLKAQRNLAAGRPLTDLQRRSLAGAA